MLVPGLVAMTVMFAACAVLASDSQPGRAMIYAVQLWRRHRRQRH
jgi:hypothetical protein